MKLGDLNIGTQGEAYAAGHFLLDGKAQHGWFGAWSADTLQVVVKPERFHFLTARPIKKLETGFYESPRGGPSAQLCFPMLGSGALNRMMSDKREVRLSSRGDGLGEFENIGGRSAAELGTGVPQRIETMDFRASVECEGLRLRFSGDFGEVRDTNRLKLKLPSYPKGYDIEALIPWALVIVRNLMPHYRVRSYLKDFS